MSHCKSSQAKILVVDDEPSMREFLDIMLQGDGYDVRCAENGTEAIDFFERETYDLVITDIRMKPVDGLAVLKHCKTKSPGTIVIIISAYANAETAVSAMKEGAYDYLPKPFNVDEMRTVIRDALESREDVGVATMEQDGPLYFGCIIGESPAMQKVYELISRVATTSSNVLITGESGTGKELVAKAIHRQSPRSSKPFVAVNCGGVPETLIESELFGFKKGAFTGATANKKGLVEAAQGGSLFLDEIGELSLSLQVKLLRLLQEKTIKMIGGNEEIPVDVRIITATNRDLEQMVIDNTFREDLYYRLNVIEIHVPALATRPDDIVPLAHAFLGPGHELTPNAEEALLAHGWPGNVRELANCIQRARLLARSERIDVADLGLPGRRAAEANAATEDGDQLDRAAVETALANAGGVIARAAAELRLSRQALYRRMEKLGLKA